MFNLNFTQKASTNRVVFYNLLSMVLIKGIGFITSPIFSRLLSTTNYGIITIYSTWLGVFSVFYGLQTVSTLGNARSEYPLDDQAKYQSSILSLSIFSSLFFSIITIALLGPISIAFKLRRELIVLLLIQATGSTMVDFLQSKFTMEFDAAKSMLLSIVTVLLNVSVSIVLVLALPEETNYFGRAIGQCTAYFIVGLASAVYIFRRDHTTFNREYWRFCLPLSLPLILHSLSGMILNSCDKVMLQHMMSEADVGIYGLALGFSSLITALWSAFNNAWLPFFYEYTRTNETDKVISCGKNYLELFTALTVGFILLSPDVYHVYASSDYWSGTMLIPLFVLAFYFLMAYSFAANYEFYYKKSQLIAIGTISAAAINIVLNYLLIKTYGAFGTAVATASAYLLLFLFHFFCAKFAVKESVFPFSAMFFAPWLIITVAVSIFSIICGTRLMPIRWLLGAVIGVVELARIIKRKAIF